VCYDIQQMGDKIRRQAERQLGITEIDFGQMEFNFFHVSGFSHPHILAITSDQPFKLRPLFWGLVPNWIKTADDAKNIQGKTLNARGDSVFVKPSFRHIIRKQRCLIPVNGFFESRDIRGKKFPYFIHSADDSILWLGGIWDTWVNIDTGEVLDSCSIITTEANQFMSRIHNIKLRMPLIIPEHNLQKWLDISLSDQEITQLIQPYADSDLSAYTVSKLVNRKQEFTNIAEVSQPFHYPEVEFIDSKSA
jgi:putative SOS response-associated peptidase YedK